jgi:hypothetical protein
MMSGQGSAAKSNPEKKKQPQISWEPAGGSQTVAGYPCRGFKVMVDGKLSGTGCYVAWETGAIAKSDLVPLKKMSDFFTGMSDGQSSGSMGEHLAQMEKLPGFPGVWEDASTGETHKEKQTLTGIKRGSISADKFKAPPGYKLEKLGEH